MTANPANAAPVREGLFSVDPPALLVGACGSCGAVHFPESSICPECQSSDVSPRAASPIGRVYTYTIVRSAPPGYRGETPYAIGVVELDEGLRVSATLLADKFEDLQIGDPVRFTLLELGRGAERILSFAFIKVVEE